MSKKPLSIASLSGFPEWLPEQQIVEDQFIQRIRDYYELAGFTALRSRSVEPLDVLLTKGETDKEIYVLKRIHDDDASPAKFGLHFDLTVPFARFVTEREQALVFPLKRYQIQSAWRGERPQEGRYREFIQADADVVCRGQLPLQYDIDLPGMLIDILDGFPIPPVCVRVNNRKVMDGFFQALEIEDSTSTMRLVDKLPKLGREKTQQLLEEQIGADKARKVLKLCQIHSQDTSFVDQVKDLGVTSPVLEEGLEELSAVIAGNQHKRSGAICADLSIARGFDYYTGTVYEGFMEGFEHIGAICSGGRYNDLVAQSSQGKLSLPGIGVSIGVTRILGILMGRGLLRASRSTPSCVLVALNDLESQGDAIAVATFLRSRRIPCEVFDEPKKFGEQIRYANRKGIPYVWFYNADEQGNHQVRNLSAGDQQQVDLATWTPDPSLLHPTVVRVDASEG